MHWKLPDARRPPSFASDIASSNFLKILMCPPRIIEHRSCLYPRYSRPVALVTNEPRISIFRSLKDLTMRLHTFFFLFSLLLFFSFCFLIEVTATLELDPQYSRYRHLDLSCTLMRIFFAVQTWDVSPFQTNTRVDWRYNLLNLRFTKWTREMYNTKEVVAWSFP